METTFNRSPIVPFAVVLSIGVQAVWVVVATQLLRNPSDWNNRVLCGFLVGGAGLMLSVAVAPIILALRSHRAGQPEWPTLLVGAITFLIALALAVGVLTPPMY